MTQVKHSQFRSAYLEYLSSLIGTEMWVAFRVIGEALKAEGFYVGKVVYRNPREVLFEGNERVVKENGTVLFRANPDALSQPVAFSLSNEDALDLLVNIYSVKN
jgi:hypothetical protein